MTKRFFVLFGLLMCAGAVAAEPLVAGDVEAGKQKAAVCAACHGPQGNMQSDQFPKLAGQGAPYLVEQLKLFKSGERENAIMMGQAASLSEQDMKDLAAFYASQQTRIGAADVSVAPAGAKIYHGGKPESNVPSCAGCHGPAGLGNAAAKFPRLSGQSSAYVAAQLKGYRDGSRAGYRNAAIMNGVAERLSDEDIQALASYVAGLAPATGQAGGSEYGALMQNAGNPANAGAAQTESESTDDEPAQTSEDATQAEDEAPQTGDPQTDGAAESGSAGEADESTSTQDGGSDASAGEEAMGEPQTEAANDGAQSQAENDETGDADAAGENSAPASEDESAASTEDSATEASAQ